ncbi:NUDIX domain-containing protein [Vagococcus coleopterorum]|uniref:NUDIX domain-containing protein n=1 Tax=Vagococcus coleopterorum TaxID=2714946 RepID=UPI003B8369F0
MSGSFTNKEEEKHYYENEATEAEFLSWYAKQEQPTYDMPSVTIDNVIFCYNREEDQLKLLLIKRNSHPFQNSWALPGGFVQRGESTADTCLRETAEETGVAINLDSIEQLHTFSTPNRDPRGWVVTVSYLAFIGEDPLTAGDDAKEATWFNVNRVNSEFLLEHPGHGVITLDLKENRGTSPLTLAFDHDQIILKALTHVLNTMYHEPKLLQVLGEDFSVAEARKVFAKFLGIDFRDIDHSNFKKALLPFLTEVDERSMGIGRPAKFYKLSCYN